MPTRNFFEQKNNRPLQVELENGRDVYKRQVYLKSKKMTDISQTQAGFKAIPHNSKCRYGERGAAAAGAVLEPLGGNCAVLP